MSCLWLCSAHQAGLGMTAQGFGIASRRCRVQAAFQRGQREAEVLDACHLLSAFQSLKFEACRQHVMYQVRWAGPLPRSRLLGRYLCGMRDIAFAWKVSVRYEGHISGALTGLFT